MKIIPLTQAPHLLPKAIDYFWTQWGSENNKIFYQDCIENSLNPKHPLPRFYMVLKEEKIIGSYALLTNDINSRQDLYPWFACLYVNKEHRKQGIAGQLLDHALQEAHARGYPNLYLSTDLINFYEKYNWKGYGTCYNPSGTPFKIYTKETQDIQSTIS